MSQASPHIDWERLARASTHWIRVSILEALTIDGGRTLSPNELSKELQAPLPSVSYHVTELKKAGLLELVGERPARGATEHFYGLAVGVKRSESELREWVEDRRSREVAMAPANPNSAGGSMAMGAIETLEALKAWLDGDDEA